MQSCGAIEFDKDELTSIGDESKNDGLVDWGEIGDRLGQGDMNGELGAFLSGVSRYTIRERMRVR